MLRPSQFILRSAISVAALTSASALAAPVTLFTVERNKNANQVNYELRDDLSIHPFWRMLAKDGHLEELLGRESSDAYGIQILSQNPLKFTIVAKPLATYPFTVWTNPPAGHPYATVQLGGGTRRVKRIYLRLSGMFLTHVDFIDFEVQDGDSGPLLYFTLSSKSGYKDAQVSCVPEWMPGC